MCIFTVYIHKPMRLTKAWTAINRLSFMWKSDLSDKTKEFFPSRGRVNSSIWMHHMDTDKAWREKT